MILCCGEALIDMIPAPTTAGSAGFVPHSGGAVFNTAIALGRLGAPVGMLTALSTDMFGEQIFADLRASNVDTRHIIRSERPSTLAFVQLKDGQATYAFFDENTAERMMRHDDIPTVDPAVTALYFGGISLARDPGAQAYAALAEEVKERCVVMLDPNIRTGFISDESVYRTRIGRMIAVADIVKVSDEDLAWLHEGPDSLEGKIDLLRRAGPPITILTRGAEGASAWLSDGTRVDVPVAKADVVDTVGAGDTFNAGVLAALHEQGCLSKAAIRDISDENLSAAMTLGARAAAVTVSRAGANPPTRDEL